MPNYELVHCVLFKENLLKIKIYTSFLWLKDSFESILSLQIKKYYIQQYCCHN